MCGMTHSYMWHDPVAIRWHDLSHVIHKWVTSHTNLSRHMWMSRDSSCCGMVAHPHERFDSSTRDVTNSYGTWLIYTWHELMRMSRHSTAGDTQRDSCVIHEWVTSLTNETCHLELSHICMHHGTIPLRETHDVMHVMYEWVLSHVNESCQLGISHICMSHGTIPLRETHDVMHIIYESVTQHDLRIWWCCVTDLYIMCDVIHFRRHVRRDPDHTRISHEPFRCVLSTRA